MRSQLAKKSLLAWILLRRALPSSLAALLLSTTPAYAEFVVIVHKDADVRSMSKDEVARVFMMKSKTLPNGREVVPLSQSSREQFNDRFFDLITQRSRLQRDAYWARLMFTGKGQQPKSVESDAAMLAAVAAHPKYIGFIDSKSLDNSVTVVFRIE
ncbi:Hypothetical protein HDN1F_17190 [gamma proteobacterium HdN1]|nr:Hypothetical protein HDN1F_17190 [gamma proteobacterium HdN1]